MISLPVEGLKMIQNLGSIVGSGRSPGEGNAYPLQYSFLGESHGQRNLVGYSTWGHKESNMPEQLTLTLSVQFSCSAMFNCLWPHGLQHSRLSCPSPTPGTYSNSCPSSQWCHPANSSSVIPFSSCLQAFPPSGSLPMSHYFVSGGQSIGASASASVLTMNFRIDWIDLAILGTLKSLLQHHSSQASILQHSTFFIYWDLFMELSSILSMDIVSKASIV